jgi:hypothetical protein
MKKWVWLPILVLLLFLFCCQKQEEAEQTEVKTVSEKEGVTPIAQTIRNKLDFAVDNLEKGQVSEGAELLLDSVLLVKPLDSWPEGFAEGLSSAKEGFAAGNYSEAVGLVTNALNLIKQPEEIEKPAESGEIAPVAGILKRKIEEAREAFQKGNTDQGVISILEALQLFAPRTK